MGQPVTLDTTVFGHGAEEVYMRGQCPALAAALSKTFPHADIKIATAQGGRVLVHAWLEHDGLMTDAEQFFEPTVHDFVEEMFYQWGSVDIETLSRDELIAMLEHEAPGSQDWAAAEAIAPAYLDTHEG